RVFAGVSHSIQGEIAHRRFSESNIEEIITTDSVPQADGPKVHVVGIAPLLGEAIRRIHSGHSITTLFAV
ncbi:MAG: ribose-phosphate diphosphokinase, partial [Luteolibacter sp.]